LQTAALGISVLLLGAGIGSVQKYLGQKEIPRSRRDLFRDKLEDIDEELLEYPPYDRSIAK
jgi:hypothetical protein